MCMFAPKETCLCCLKNRDSQLELTSFKGRVRKQWPSAIWKPGIDRGIYI